LNFKSFKKKLVTNVSKK